jgi:site-specific recombinase XerC
MAGKTQGWKLKKNSRTGIYQVRFRVDGKRYHRSTGKTDRAEAQSAAARLVRRLTEGDGPDHGAPDVPLPELIGSWLAGVRSEVSPETLRTWELYAGAHFIPHFHSADRLCSERCLRDYMRKRLQEVKARTVQKELSALRRLLTWMVEGGLVQEAPTVPKLPRRATGTAHPSGRRKRIDLSPEEMDAIVRALPTQTRDGQPLRAYFEIMRETGLRPGTLQRLRAPDDYRPGSRFLRIRAEADKARYAREVPLTARAREVLDAACPAEGILFPKFAWRYPLRTAALAAGLEPDRASNVKPYDFRHSVATELTERSGNLLGVGYLLGHRHATTTNQYVHARRRAAESVLLGQNLGQIESGFEVGKNAARANSLKSLQCEGQDSNLHALRTLEPKSSASANSATLAWCVMSGT